MNQFTVKSPISIEGIGVHSGKFCKISINPAPCSNGIVYALAPYDEHSIVNANYKNVSDTAMCTKISNEFGVTVSLIEHISAAFYALGITNAIVNADGNEIPIFDGSAKPFVEAIKSVGTREQSEIRRKIRILKTVKVGDAQRWASLSPSDHFVIRVQCDFSKKGLATEPFVYDSLTNDFERDIARARTFGFLSDAEYLRKNNLAIGASLDNTAVFDDRGNVINPEGLRYSNEPIRHKILDVIGDLSLAGYEIIGRYDSFCPGHGINNSLLTELFKNKDAFQ